LPTAHTTTLFPYTTLFRSEEVIFDHAEPRLAGPKAKQPDYRRERNRRSNNKRDELRPSAARATVDQRPDKQHWRRWTKLVAFVIDRKSTRLNSSHVSISYA